MKTEAYSDLTTKAYDLAAEYGEKFNLDNWTFSIELGEETEVLIHPDYKVAVITLDKNTQKCDLRASIKHEMVHILLSPLERLEEHLGALESPLVTKIVQSTNEQLCTLLCDIL